ncbi:MAG: CBS domain-containing protein [Dehalococcoidales bacterium]|nr:CBS domain-containing protein [Dehalococcoidales bacterium]
MLVGWVLQSAATQSRLRVRRHEALQDFTARDIISRESPLITPDISLARLAHDFILVTGHHYFAVTDGGKLQGVVTMRQIKSIPPSRWGSTNVGKIMTPARKVKTALAGQSAASLLEQMDEFRLSEMPVIDKGEAIGIATRDRLTRLIKARAELRLL